MDNNYDYEYDWDDQYYGTGSTQPPKNRSGLIALLLILLIFLFFGRRSRIGLGRKISKKLIQEWECGGLTIHVISVPIHAVQLTKHAAHLVAEIVQILLGKAHLLYRSIDLRNPQTARAFQAISLVHRNAIFHFRDENDG